MPKLKQPYAFPSRLKVVEDCIQKSDSIESAKLSLMSQEGFESSEVDRMMRVLIYSHPDLRDAIDSGRCPEAIAYRLSKLALGYQAIVVESEVYKDCSVNVAVAQLRRDRRDQPTITQVPRIEGTDETRRRMGEIRPLVEELIVLLPERASELRMLLEECARGWFETLTF